MMMKLRVLFLPAVVLLCGCDHHKAVSQSSDSAPVSEEAALTGTPPATVTSVKGVYPRAALVSLPPDASQADANTPPAAPETPPSVASTDQPSSAPSNPAPTPPDAAPAPVPTPAPAASTDEAVPRLTMTTPNPVVSMAPAPVDDSSQQQVVVIATSLGHIVIQLDDAAAPKTCENFRKLVSNGFYNHTAFHRVIPHFMIQGGDPNSKLDDRTGYGQGGPGYTLPPEIKLHHERGAVAMARLPDSVNPQRESNGSQFYICVAPCPSLDDQYTVFGHVIKGMDIADRIADQQRDKRDNPLTKIEMQASLERKDKALEEGTAVNP
jgi:peptidyl-prolyl cis-trans isomerase B (cyclophilin B)